jgi:hypothetical protein
MKENLFEMFSTLNRIEVVFNGSNLTVFRTNNGKIYFEDTDVIFGLIDVIDDNYDYLPISNPNKEEYYCSCLVYKILGHIHWLYTNPDTYTNKFEAINLILEQWENMECKLYFDDKIITLPLIIDEECFYIAVKGLPV